MKSNYGYYAIAKGKKVGIVKSWDECKELTDCFSGSKYKGFNEYRDAKEWLNNFGIITADDKGDSNMTSNVIITGKTYRTNDYSLFKRLEGNRDVLSARVNKIKRSIETNGYIFNPIVVNEKYQIIDGQGRFEVLKLLNLPIDFVICEGAGLEECVVLNASGTIWKMKDYIDSYCELGNENYIRFRRVINKFKDITFSIKAGIAMGLAAAPNDVIKNGRIKFTAQNEKEAEDNLNFASLFTPIFKNMNGRYSEFFYYAVVFAHNQPEIDDKRLFETLQRTPLSPVSDIRGALDKLSDVYNSRLSQNKKVYLFPMYEKHMSEKYHWYDVLHIENNK